MDLTQKTVFLLAMASAHRGKELSFLKIHLMSSHSLYIRFQFEDRFKVQGLKDPPKETFFHRFEEDSNICPVVALEALLGRTREHRIIDCVTGHCSPTQVFLATKAPHTAVGRPSIARWLVSLIGRAGIDITTYSGHSTRSASTSKAASLGVPIEVIVQQANWKCNSTFEKFIINPLILEGNSFRQQY